MWLLFSFCLRGPLPLLPDVRWRVEGRDCGIRAELASPPCPRGRGTEMRQVLRHLPCLTAWPGRSRGRGVALPPAARPPDGCVCDFCLGSSWCSWSAPGWSLRCPRLSWRCRFLSPGARCPSVSAAACLVGACAFACGRSFFCRLARENPQGGGRGGNGGLPRPACAVKERCSVWVARLRAGPSEWRCVERVSDRGGPLEVSGKEASGLLPSPPDG